MLFKVKFFGAKERRQQISQVKCVVEAPSRDRVEETLQYKMGYEVINGLKIREYDGE